MKNWFILVPRGIISLRNIKGEGMGGVFLTKRKGRGLSLRRFFKGGGIIEGGEKVGKDT